VTQKLTNSRRKLFNECSRKHHYTYNLGYRPRKSGDALLFGSGFHLALETWALSESRAIPDVRALRDAKGRPIQIENEFEYARLQALVAGWVMRWGNEPMEYVAVEVEFEMPLVHPVTGETSSFWVLGGKIDGIVKRAAKKSTLEYKTTSEDKSPGSVYWQRLPMNSQISLYADGAVAVGHPPESCVYDVSLRPQQRPLKQNKKNPRDETPDEFYVRILKDIAANPADYFSRGEIVRFENELVRARLDVWETAEQMRFAIDSGCHPRNPESCHNFNRSCAFLPICLGETQLENADWLVKSDNVHPELG
jgi:hypothetical protein